MWVFTRRGFYSIVQDKDDPKYLIVRARVKGDIEALIPEDRKDELEFPIEETPDSDYRFRTKMDRESVGWIVGLEAEDIDYTNYKAAVHMVDQRRSEYYGMVWAIMADMQDNFLNEK